MTCLYANRLNIPKLHNAYPELGYAIDRIENVTETTVPYSPLPDGFDFEEYFADVVGVSVTSNPVEEIELHVSEKTIGYIITKPMHESQCTRPERLDNGWWRVTLKAQVNYELLSLLRSFGTGVVVVSPQSLRDRMKRTLEELAELYKD